MNSDQQQSGAGLNRWLKAQVAGRSMLFVGLDAVEDAVAFAAAGHLVVGIERNAARVAEAEHRLSGEPEETRARVQFRTGIFDGQVGVLPNAPERRFDTLVLRAGAFGEADLPEVLSRGFERLNPGGRLLVMLPFGQAADQAGVSWRVRPSQLVAWVAESGWTRALDCEGEWFCLAADKPAKDAAPEAAATLDPALLLELTETIWAADQEALARRNRAQAERLRLGEAEVQKAAAQASGAEAALLRLVLAPETSAEAAHEIALACDRHARDADSAEERLALSRLAHKLAPTPPRQARLGRLLLDSGAKGEGLDLLSAPGVAEALSSGVRRLCVQAGEDAIPPALPDLRLAGWGRGACGDDLGPECDFLALPEDGWREALVCFDPDLLLVAPEDAARVPTGLAGVCRELKVPMVVWLREDAAAGVLPPVAHAADVVLLDDAARVANGRAELGHDRVHFLAPACQPRRQNPLCPPDTPTAVEDAGTGDLLPGFSPEEIADLGIKSVPSGQAEGDSTALAAALPGIMARGHIPAGGYARGHRLLFGDLLISSDNAQERGRRWQQDIAPRAAHIRQAMLRKVLAQHCWDHRLERIAALAGVVPRRAGLPNLRVLARADTADQATALQAHFTRQLFDGAEMTIVLSPEARAAEGALEASGIAWLSQETARETGLSELVSEEGWIAVFRPEHYYGPNYLCDLMLATRFATAPVMGKGAAFRVTAEGLQAAEDGSVWASVDALPASGSVVRGDALPSGLSIADAARGDWAVGETGEKAALTLDNLSFCRDGSDALGAAKPGVAEAVDGPVDLRCGIELAALERWSDRIDAEADHPVPEHLDGAVLGAGFTPPTDGKLVLDTSGSAWKITSTLDPGVHRYLFEDAARPLPPDAREKPLAFHLRSEGDVHLLWAVLFFDETGARVGDAVIPANTNGAAEVPETAVSLRYGIRLRGPGSVRVERVYLGHKTPRVAAPLPSGSETLLISNQYPSYGALYRNGFVHRRVRGYQGRSRDVEVFRLLRDQDLAHAEFENVDYATGSSAQLARLLESRQHRRVLVHFLTPEIWSCLQPVMDRFERVTVWIHGADIQAWWHRPHDHPTDAERARAQVASDDRLAFWRGILGDMPENLHLVFVSDYLARQTMDDLGITLSPKQYSVIHNPIDTTLFAYHPKPVEQRRQILSIRPYTAPTYANDLTVKAILALRDHPDFQKLSFRIIGDGPLYDATVDPLRGLENVHLDKRFVAQTEIARLHRDAGVFLCPSRMDTQGVSRDEAMSSGLVPVTSRVAAIPEFVDDSCGVLAPPEDAVALARAIATLQDDPNLFARLSREAAARVRRQSAMDEIISRELAFADP